MRYRVMARDYKGNWFVSNHNQRAGYSLLDALAVYHRAIAIEAEHAISDRLVYTVEPVR